MINTNTFSAFTSLLATETGISEDAATKVGEWLKGQGVLDFTVISESFDDETVA